MGRQGNTDLSSMSSPFWCYINQSGNMKGKKRKKWRKKEKIWTKERRREKSRIQWDDTPFLDFARKVVEFGAVKSVYFPISTLTLSLFFFFKSLRKLDITIFVQARQELRFLLVSAWKIDIAESNVSSIVVLVYLTYYIAQHNRKHIHMGKRLCTVFANFQ